MWKKFKEKIGELLAYFVIGVVSFILGKQILHNRKSTERDRECKDKLDDVSGRVEGLSEGIASDVKRLSELTEQIRKQQVLE